MDILFRHDTANKFQQNKIFRDTMKNNAKIAVASTQRVLNYNDDEGFILIYLISIRRNIS